MDGNKVMHFPGFGADSAKLPHVVVVRLRSTSQSDIGVI